MKPVGLVPPGGEEKLILKPTYKRASGAVQKVFPQKTTNKLNKNRLLAILYKQKFRI